MQFATGAVLVPTLAPGEPVELVATLDRKLAQTAAVSLMKNAALLEADAKVALVSQTETTVTFSVAVENGLAGAGVVFVIAMELPGPPVEVPPIPPRKVP